MYIGECNRAMGGMRTMGGGRGGAGGLGKDWAVERQYGTGVGESLQPCTEGHHAK
jgi:hypothetical protein